MSAKDLCTLARAKINLPQITDSSQDSRLSTFITAVSDAIAKYCRRDFYARNYDELYSGVRGRRLLLRAYPVQSVKSVRYGSVTVLKIQNSDTATNQQARVQVTSTGLTLTRVASGVTTTNTLAFGTYVTLQDLATAVTALANGWTAQVAGSATGDYGKWPSAELYVPASYGDGVTSQGSLNARGQYAELKLHAAELAAFQFDPRGWLLFADPTADLICIPTEDCAWSAASNYFRVQYTAGYTTIPEAAQEACAEWVAELYWLTLRDPSAESFSQPGVASTLWRVDPGKPSAVVQRLLAPYRRHTISTNQG